MQTLAITFTGSPIPFAKTGSFPPKAIQDIIQSVKDAIKAGKSALNAIKQEFANTVANGTSTMTQALESAEIPLNELTKNGWAGLQKAMPDLFTRTGAVANARTALLDRLGSVTQYANDPQNRIGGMTIAQWSVAGNTLYDSMQSFKNHVNNLQGINVDDKLLVGEEIYGNIALSGTINIASTNTATANLSKTSYPAINVGSTIAVNSKLYVVTGRTYTLHTGGGTVSVTANDVYVNTASLTTLNLANIVLATGSTLKVTPGMYINVNNEIKQVNTINARGDYLTVTRPFRNANASASLYKETGFTVNTNFTSTNTDILVYRYTAFTSNSVCLDNVITGNGTSFSSVLSANDKIYYDDLEYFVVAVTNTTITVDAPLRGKENMVVYKVVDEQYTQQMSETYDPEDIIDDFSLMRELFDGMPANPDGSPWISDLSTKYRASNGQYMTASAYNPTDVTGSLENGRPYMAAVKKTVQGLIDDLQNDAIRYMSDNELTTYLENKLQEVEDLRATLNDSVQKDLAAINAVKGLIKGLLKFWKHSCGRKNLKTGEEAIEDDEFLESVLLPNPMRQGCDATKSDLIDILNDFSDALDTPENEPAPVEAPIPPDATDPALFNLIPDAVFVLETPKTPQNAADIVIDNVPDPSLPPVLEDPCVQPC